MLNLTDIHSFSEFQRNAKAHVRRLKETGKPEVLTINGQAELVIQDAAAYQQLIEAAEEIRVIKALRASISEADRNEGRPFRDAIRELAADAGIALPE